MRRCTRFVAMLATVLVAFIGSLSVTACGSSGNGPTEIKPPVITVTSVVFSCGTTVLVGAGTKTACTATAYKSDNTSVDATSSATWSSSVPSVAVVTAGVVTAVSAGSSQVTATFGGVTSSSLRVDVQVPATPVSLAISGRDTTLHAGTAVKYDAVLKYSDGSTKVVVATWSAFSSGAELEANGTIHAMRVGTSQIIASYQGLSSPALNITVVGTHRAELPPTSDSVWNWVRDSILASDGHLQKFTPGPKKVFVGVGIDVAKVTSGLAKLQAVISTLTFTITTDSASADIWETTYIPPALVLEGCANGGNVDTKYNIATRGIVHIIAGSKCATDERILLHEIIHAISYFGHTKESGVMSWKDPQLSFGPFLMQVLQWMYSDGVPAGAVLIP